MAGVFRIESGSGRSAARRLQHPGRRLGLRYGRRLGDSLSGHLGRSGNPRRAEGAERDHQATQLIWQQLHGIVSLRISRPRFPWPPLEETVVAAVDRLLGPAHQ